MFCGCAHSALRKDAPLHRALRLDRSGHSDRGSLASPMSPDKVPERKTTRPLAHIGIENRIAMFRRDTPTAAEFRMEILALCEDARGAPAGSGMEQTLRGHGMHVWQGANQIRRHIIAQQGLDLSPGTRSSS
jgi:hypothetical protein